MLEVSCWNRNDFQQKIQDVCHEYNTCFESYGHQASASLSEARSSDEQQAK